MPPASTSIWSPLRQPAFRGLWICGAIFFIGAGMQTMAAAWLMVELTGSSFLAALVQTAVFLPMFLLALPAGVLADTTDRRRLISMSLLAQLVASTLLVPGEARLRSCADAGRPVASRAMCGASEQKRRL